MYSFFILAFRLIQSARLNEDIVYVYFVDCGNIMRAKKKTRVSVSAISLYFTIKFAHKISMFFVEYGTALVKCSIGGTKPLMCNSFANRKYAHIGS